MVHLLLVILDVDDTTNQHDYGHADRSEDE